MEAGIVGLPNVGKSTLFNALTLSKAAASENYPFCTIEPNEGIVSVPDPRLDNDYPIHRAEESHPSDVETGRHCRHCQRSQRRRRPRQ